MQKRLDTQWLDNNIQSLLSSLSGETIGYYQESLDLIYNQMSNIENVYIEIEEKLERSKNVRNTSTKTVS